MVDDVIATLRLWKILNGLLSLQHQPKRKHLIQIPYVGWRDQAIVAL